MIYYILGLSANVLQRGDNYLVILYNTYANNIIEKKNPKLYIPIISVCTQYCGIIDLLFVAVYVIISKRFILREKG